MKWLLCLFDSLKQLHHNGPSLSADHRLPATSCSGLLPLAHPLLLWKSCPPFDIQEITTGATVQIPINHDGALLHIGDMHAIQGDGEISGGGGIETGGTVKLKCSSSEKPEGMTWPRIINDTHIMTTAQARPAEDAFRVALSEMLLWLENDFNINKKEGFMLLAQVLEARVTQFVNPTYTYLLKVNKKYLF